MKFVMYHYVRPGTGDPPYGYYYLDHGDFRAQLEYFDEEFTVLDREALFATIRGTRSPGTDDIVLTFDDGLRDHAEHVLPELGAMDMWGIFYVPAGPYVHDEVLDVHRIHTLLGRAGGAAVAAALDDVVEESMLSTTNRDRFEGEIYRPQTNTDHVERAKSVLNYYLADEYRGEVLDALERELLGGLLDPSAVYMSEEQLRELKDAGMLLGTHTVTHRVMSTLSRYVQEREIRESFEWLSDAIGGLERRTYAHPYGGEHAYTDETLALLRDADCAFSVDVDKRDVTGDVLDTERQRLPRFDCNDFPHGESTVSLG